ncbi:MAG: nucleotidyl transferase AbiEii/AbiGii toxin family protein, partial [Clostridia bacterium]|nr:nucleotidyl transferase AbiEii/AbiGii toxin family protein [Clostridia bacterium]
MNLHNNKTEFQELITLTANDKNIPESAVERDYFIVRALLFLSKSEYVKSCVFKGGTSLSKCYPGSIERFSEDIDLTYIPEEGMSDKQIERRLKSIEKIMTVDSSTEIIRGERNQRNKSTYFWCDIPDNRIKLEIGSSVRPEPYASRTMKSYIQEYLEENGYESVVEEYELTTVTMNVLNIERTFIDKIMSVKRHSICGSINSKARHIYDVTRLFNLPEIESFLQDKQELKRLIKLTKQTDSIYFEKRNIPESYN